uniref:synaptonemal complex protein 1 n=1 Tax=Semicossyphus pulcher TaxID=241346 RepID=UPI0037E7D76F
MERDRGFNFKLLVPPRVNKGQVSAVRPQEIVDNCGDFMNTLEQGYSKCFDKEQTMPFVSTSVVAPTKPTRQDFPKTKFVPPMEKDENNCNPGQLYTKLFDEVEKIKSWKIKADSDTVQKERRLQENKRTIETQRKAIQELQFGNESLSIKLEEQITENEDLRNKNNATRNLCNLLKDTLERSAEKMHVFESEREETHRLFMENSGGIQKLITAFESLHIQAEADQQEMQKVKEGLQQFEILKVKYIEEHDMQEKEVEVLQTKLKEKENEIKTILLDLHETQQHCKQLGEATNEQYELLKCSEAEKESLLQKLQSAEQCLKETEKNREAIAALLRESKEKYAEKILSKDFSLQELGRVKNQQAEKLEQIQTTLQELQNSLALEIQRAKELEDKLVENKKELETRSALLRETMEQSAKKEEQIKILEDELDKKSKSLESMKSKIGITEDRLKELTVELSRKNKEAQLFKNEAEVALAENDLLKKTCEIKVQELEQQLFSEVKKNEEHNFQMEQLRKDITQNEVKYKELLSNFNELQSEKEVIQQQFESRSSNVKAIEANIKVNEEKAVKLTKEIQRLEEENQRLREEVHSVKNRIQGKYQETENLQKKIEEKCDLLQEEITEKEKQIKAAETKLCNLKKKLELKLKANEEFQKENKVLKKQIAKEIAKSDELENVINNLYKESQNLKQLNEEDHQQLLKDLEFKSAFAAELENEVQNLRLTTAEAIKHKEDAELKCQHKIADMVALMEKHKSQYDRMVEEKDSELGENKKKEMEAVAQKKSLEFELVEHKTDNDQLRKQLRTEVTEKANLQKELTDIKKEMSSMKITQLSEARNKQSPAPNYTQGKCSKTPKVSSAKRHVFDFSKSRKTAAVMKKDEIKNRDLKTPKSITNRVEGSSKIKSYRIRTPPSAEKAACWRTSTIELDPKSDSSDLNDLLIYASAPAPNFSAPACKLNIFKKIQSPVPHKSPGNSLKLAAMKRMRDAGWTAVTGCDKKKKKTSEKIFA